MAGEEEALTWQDKVLLFFAVLLVFILIFLILIFFCRQRLAKWFPCLVVKVKPEEKTGWHHLNRFGEVKLKTASYSLPEIRARRLPEDSVEEGSVQTNISLQVPVFEEKLNSTVTKKSVHMASTDLSPEELQTSPKKKKKKKRRKPTSDPADPDNDLESEDQGSPVHNEEAV